MSGLNLEDLHKKLYNNTIKIRSIEKENKQLLEDIENYDIYENNKLEEFNNTLKEVLNIQKQFNKLVSDTKSPITNKYLNLPYDINEIIRNKIKEDSKLKFKHSHIDKCFKLIESKFQRQILAKISNMTYIYYNNPSNNRVAWLRSTHLADWNELFDKFNGNRWMYWIGEFSTYNINCFELHNTKILNDECSDYIKKKFEDLYDYYENLRDCIGNLFNLVEEKKYGNNRWWVSSFIDWRSGEFIRLRNSNGRKNGIGYKKLKKCINDILYTYLYDKNEGNYIITSDTYDIYWSKDTDWKFPESFYSEVYNSNYELVEESFKNPRYN